MRSWHTQAVLLTLVAGTAALLAGGCQTGGGARTSVDQAAERSGDGALYPFAEERRRQVQYFRENYDKHEYRIPMRDGVRLFTTVYSPKDTRQSYPLLMRRTPYSVSPYGADEYPEYPWYLGPDRKFAAEGFIFVYQDVRGCFMSEGKFVNMRPHQDEKSAPTDIDESTDTYDTIEWLLRNVPNHNGRVGMWGISYPGFYAAAGMIDAHPALVAVSPQAPIADWYFDDFHHHGAFFLSAAFNFFVVFEHDDELTTTWGEPFYHPTPDGYQFFLDLGPLSNVNERYFHREKSFWNELVAHPDYDEFWQSRNILPHLRNVTPAVMTVGGWFDAEDLYGPLKIYQTIEQRNPDVFNVLVMGPWYHGGWDRCRGDAVGNVHFGTDTSVFYRDQMELPFFCHYLKDQGELALPEAYMFDTGANRWRKFAHWPPRKLQKAKLFLRHGGELGFEPPDAREMAYDEYLSDPARPVPVTLDITTEIPKAYMTDDQRFAARRPDVLVYQSAVLRDDVTLAGPLNADLWVSTSGTDADWVIKLIDVYPDDAPDHANIPTGLHMGGYQMLVRGQVLRGRYRNSYTRPEPFVAGQPTRIELELLDVLHTFRAGHRIMIQIQSSWFPLVDRNPQTYVDNIFHARPEDFIKATHRVYRCAEYPSHLRVGRLPAE
ncbi:MAG: CocE/NonD family hydrolase [Planctomycetota bacterium]